MTIKDQFVKLKENWVLALFLIVAVVFLGAGNILSGVVSSISSSGAYYDSYESDGSASYAKSYGGFAQEMAADSRMMGSPVYYDEGFAPNVPERMITKTSSLTTEVERGKYLEAEKKIKALILSTDSILLNENLNKYGMTNSYLEGSYEIKVISKKYDALLTQLKEIGEVQYFQENAQDVTEQNTDLKTELEAEKSRLERFKEMLAKAEEVSEQIELTDRIFNLERTIAYYEDALQNLGNRVEYSTIYLTMQEKQSNYANIALTKFSQLLRNLVESINDLLSLIFWALPWVVAGVVIWVGVKFFKKKRK
ncbi:DUF4349 domain-containing protein [Candidatus Woesearchaeota archaeon]|nr:DUF4349 domain-containing protein [Candidatus Woesearchaeota archaeon]